ncbi:MAG: transglycosylase domain-containing protein [Nocardioides sp.]
MSVPAEERLSGAKVLSHLTVMGLVAVVLGVVTAGLAIPFAGALGIGAKNLSDTMEHLPVDLTPGELAQKTVLVDSRGNTIATLYDQNRISVPLTRISRTMTKAIVAIEDYRFYEHGALDLKGTLRALITNQASGAQVQGGSSITQQLVKLTLLDQAKTKRERIAATDDTYERKIRELRYAIALEQKYSKDWILERYLNTAYFGDGAYGVQAAAKHYFGVNAKDLNLPQSALLAGLVKNPTGYDPTNYPDRAVARRNVVLDRMAELNVITQTRVDKTKDRDLGLDVQETPNGCVNSVAPFFCDYVVEYLLHDKTFGKNRNERKKTIYSGGFTIQTTLDQRFQQAADQSVRDHVYAKNSAIGALAMVEPRTGHVRALAQSRPMGNLKKRHETYLNYTVPKEYGGARGFQPGSTFKAFVLAAAVQKGIPLDMTIEAPAQVVVPMSQYDTCKGRYQSGDVWPPQNSTGSGNYSLYTGTRQSVNTFYAQLELATGLCEPYRLAKAMGIRLTDPLNERVPSFTLGVADVSPLEMAEAYATFAGRGLHCDASPVTSVEGPSGAVVAEYQPDCQQVIDAPVADAVNAVLRGVQEPGGFGYSNGLGLTVPSAAKTGTTNENRAVWFMGYTPSWPRRR